MSLPIRLTGDCVELIIRFVIQYVNYVRLTKGNFKQVKADEN